MQMKAKLTRRELAAAVALPAMAQTAAAPQPTADEDLQAAQRRMRENRAAMDAVALPMSTEPAFQFRA
jgi:hypothetical protein